MDMTVILVTAGAGIIIGLLIGLMINALRGDSSKTASPSVSSSRGIDNILLWHDKEGGNLIVDLDGSTFLRVNEMRADQRSRLETVYSQLKRFMGVQDTTPRPATVTPAAAQVEQSAQVPFTEPLSQPVPAQTFTSQSVPAQTIPAQPAPVQSIPIRPAPATPATAAVNPKTNDLPAVTEDKKGAKKPLPAPIKPLNIVGEIDEILQDMIAGTPLLERGLELVETPAHTIAVRVDSHQFESIDAVTDPEVQQIIRSAVKNWENKLR
jgi:hypothetical protein